MPRKATKQKPVSDADYWSSLTLMIPPGFAEAARDAAHAQKMPVTEYCRQALLRLAADGMRLEDYAD